MSSNSSIQAYNRLKDYVNEHILDFIPEIDPLSKDLYDAMKYSVLAGGKRIRPILCLAACDLCAGKLDFALPYACAIEYIHTYSLIHDDLPCMDDDDYRRGQLTNHKVFGEALALLAGDGLLSTAFECMNKDMLLYMDAPELLKCKVRAAYSISKGVGVRGMVAGQVADIEATDNACSTELLDYIHINKTAAFIRASVLSGAFLGGATSEIVHDLAVYGENLGLAFQIVDDILDVTSSLEEMGKESGSDAALNKSTYPALYGLDTAKQKAKALIDKAKASIAKYYDNAEVLNYIAELLEEKIK